MAAGDRQDAGAQDAIKAVDHAALVAGIVMSEAVMMALASKMGRGQAHDLLYRVCRQALDQDKQLAEVLAADKDIAEQLSAGEIKRLTDPARYLGCASEMIDQVLELAEW